MIFVVNNQEWKIKSVSPRNWHLRRSDGSFTLGVTDNLLKTIFIVEGLTESKFRKVLTHELCHVFSFSYGLDMSIETEEIVADFMSLYGKSIIECADKIFELLKFL